MAKPTAWRLAQGIGNLFRPCLDDHLGTRGSLIATVLSLPLDMPVIEFDRDSQHETWKLNDVRNFVGDRPFTWIDDDLWSDALDWAEERSSATLLVRVAPHRGLTQSHVERLEVFGRSLMGTTDRDPDDPL